MIDGRTVREVKGEPRTADEIASLWEYLGNRLKGDFRTTMLTPAMQVPAAAQVTL